jgi:ATP-binding cassette subfamily B protein
MMGRMMQQKDETKRVRDVDRQVLRMFAATIRPHLKTLLAAVGAASLVAAANIAAPMLTALAIDRCIIPKNPGGLLWVFLGFIGVYGVYWAASYASSYLTSKLGQRVVADIRGDLFRHVSSLSMDYFAESKTGNLVSRIIGDVNTLAEFISSGMVHLVGDVITILGIVAVMFLLNVRLSLVVTITVPLVLAGTSLIGRRMRKANAAVRQKTADLNAGVEENISGIRVVQAASRQKDNIDSFEKLNRETMSANTKAMLVTALFFPFMSISGVVGTALVVLAGGIMAAGGGVTIGIITAFLGYTNRFFMPLRDLSQIYNTYQTAAASAERIHQMLGIRPAVRPPQNPEKLPLNGKGPLEFKGVSFAYQGGKDVITDLNLVIVQGQTTALVGPTGAGKSTLIKLLSRLYDPQKGEVSIDGVDIRNLSFKDLRETVMVVPQEVFLFAGSIRENIRYGKTEASDEEVVQAAKNACADSFIARLPKGYDTEVGEGGALLSGGQRQLIAFARAILADRPVLVLDEATSSVDAATESLIKEALDRLIEGRTTLMIAHRFTTLQRAQRIAVMENGEIVGYDTHEKLLKTCGLYRDLYEKQWARV